MTEATLLGKASRTADQVRAEAKELDPVKVALTLLFVPFFVIGWAVRMVVRACWAVFSLVWSAVVVGWRTAGPPVVAERDDRE